MARYRTRNILSPQDPYDEMQRWDNERKERNRARAKELRVKAAQEREREQMRERQREEDKNRVYENLRELSTLDMSKVVCVDIETTGLDRNRDEILQVSVIDGNGKTIFNEYIKPSTITEWDEAAAINGIYPQDVADKPTLDYRLNQLNRIFTEAELIVGYNSDHFDLPFLSSKGVCIPGDTPTFDVMTSFADIIGEPDDKRGGYKYHKLVNCAAHYGYEDSGEYHNSLADTAATLHCFRSMLNDADQIETLPNPHPKGEGANERYTRNAARYDR